MGQAEITGTGLDDLQRQTFGYFAMETNPGNGLVRDKTERDSPASIAAVGLALASYPVGVRRGFMSRDEAAQRTLVTLRFFHDSRQTAQADATGYKGFFYHFLDMKSGQRANKCELSTGDSALLLAGMLTTAAYFTDESDRERQIRALAAELYARADWRWALNGGAMVSHGWTPEDGFLESRWQGYDEALLLYLLGLGSPTHALPVESYAAWTSTYKWREVCGHEFLYSGPLFTHQLSHIWIDFRGIQDAFMRGKCIDYFENSRRAAYAQRQYAIQNPGQFEGYGAECWGITASDGPADETLVVNGKARRFFRYAARGVPDGPDDGTLAPWAVVASLPFAPEIVLPTMRHFDALDLRSPNPYGFKATFNETYPKRSGRGECWISPDHYGLNQGPVVLMIENFRSGLVWRLMRRCPCVVRGLLRAGFSGGWLESRHGELLGSPTGKTGDHPGGGTSGT